MEEKEKEEDKMGLKEFFKPTKGKIILLILIFMIISFIPFDKQKKVYVDEYCDVSMYKVYVEIFVRDLGCNISGTGTFDYLIIIPFLIHLFISYFVTCLIIFFYNQSKFKSKNHKR